MLELGSRSGREQVFQLVHHEREVRLRFYSPQHPVSGKLGAFDSTWQRKLTLFVVQEPIQLL